MSVHDSSVWGYGWDVSKNFDTGGVSLVAHLWGYVRVLVLRARLVLCVAIVISAHMTLMKLKSRFLDEK